MPLYSWPSCYKTVLAQTFSPKGTELIVGDDQGRVYVIKIEEAILRKRREGIQSQEVLKKSRNDYLFVNIFSLPNCKSSRITSMSSTEHALVIGTVGQIYGYLWDDLLRRSPSLQPAWNISLSSKEQPVIIDDLQTNENSAEEKLFVTNEESIEVFDIETRMKLKNVQAHDEFVHQLSFCKATGLLASASEDGTVKLWDWRKSKPLVHKMKPSEKSFLSRAKLGKWVGTVSLMPEWLACGGGPKASIWHLRTLSPQEPALNPDSFDKGIHTIKLHNDQILFGGEDRNIYQTNMSGDVQSVIPVSSSCIYSIICQEEPFHFLSSAGTSANLDICASNFSYKDQIISLP